MELATIPVPADNGLAQYYTEEASGLSGRVFRGL